MNKVFFILGIILASALCTQAQISDADAKLQYQQITDAYDATDYYKAAQLSQDLKNNMGNWTPKVLYIYLKSVYKSYTETKQSNANSFGRDYEVYTGFAKLCDTFFSITNQVNYPPDKYKEIQDIQQYLQSQASKNKGRTPQDAINFIVKVSKAYPSTLADGNHIDSMRLQGTELTIWSMYPRIGLYRITMNLSKVHWEGKKNNFFDHILSDNKEDIKHYEYIPYRGYSEQKLAPSVVDLTGWFDCWNLNIANNFAEFNANHYLERIYDAFDFLIKQAGGGKKPDKPADDKF